MGERLSEHEERVAHLAVRIGQTFGLPQRDLELLDLGACLHDIGKAGVPGHILEKAGPLTDNERAVMQQHALLGDGLARSLRIPEQARLVVRHHHERWDGAGYPDSLRGSAIPLLARIVAVADAYDAMIHDRPYRPRRSPAAASAELQRHAGTQFDPAIVAVFIKTVGAERRAS